MAEIKPFRGIRYNLEKIGDNSLVVAPVYDVISRREREHYYERHPQNVIRLILPEPEPGGDPASRYDSANRYFQNWLDEGILIQDPQPCIYLYRQLYLFEGKLKEATGIIARVKLEEFSSGKIHPHENILEKPLEDRLNLIRACRANFSQILALYSDPDGELLGKLSREMERFPLEQFQAEDGVSHTIWAVGDPRLIRWAERFLNRRELFIADGHHRYLTALEFSKAMSAESGGEDKEAPYRYVMMLLWHLEDPGITLLPVHRLVRKMDDFSEGHFLESASRWFECEELEMPSGALSGQVYHLMKHLSDEEHREPVFGAYMGGERFYLLTWKKGMDVHEEVSGNGSDDYKNLDVTALHRLLIEECLGIPEDRSEVEAHIEFTKDAIYAAREVHKGRGQIAFFQNPTRVEVVRAVALHGEKMPQKSTYFYPKPLSGTIINRVTDSLVAP